MFARVSQRLAVLTQHLSGHRSRILPYVFVTGALPLVSLFSTRTDAETAPSQRFELEISTSGRGKNAAAFVTKKGCFSAMNIGEDACFVASTPRYMCLGIADGVGGWAELGVNPAIFSIRLMAHTEASFNLTASTTAPLPAALLKTAYSLLLQDSSVPLGSSTACVATLDRHTGQMDFANLGDSGFLVIRKGHVVHRSVEQQHFFNAPYQLAKIPAKMKGDQNFDDKPEHASLSKFSLQHDDIVLLATDGLFDNVFDKDILDTIVTSSPTSPSSSPVPLTVTECSDKIAAYAFQVSRLRHYISPFVVNARAARLNCPPGGKPDDISVIVARVRTVPS